MADPTTMAAAAAAAAAVSAPGIFGAPYYQLVLLALLGLLLPVSVFVGRRNVRLVRLRMLENLKEALHLGPRLPASFAIIRARYQDQAPGLGWGHQAWAAAKEVGIYALPTIIFAALSGCGFALLLNLGEAWGTAAPRLLRGLLVDPGDPPSEVLATGLIVGAAFTGAYIWSIRYLILRIGNYDLSPLDFLHASAHILTTVLAAWVLRQVVVIPGGVTVATLLGVAFLSGFYPTLGLNLLVDRLPNWLRLKRDVAEAAEIARSFPLDLVDGIDATTRFRLNSLEIAEVQGLAATNPIELFTKTPYSLTEIVDWMLQAQLMAELGPPLFLKARAGGVRDMAAFLDLGLTEPGRRRLAPLIPAAGEGASPPTDDAAVAAYVEAVARKLHVAHLQSWRGLLTEALARTVTGSDGQPRPRRLRVVGMA